jgi:aspartyl-tRNA(Asn)/glutamyl-tRNA(Gln) amidotransferase subunit B
VRWIGICDGNMQEGSFRCDANVSVRRPGAPLGTRCEIKNLNSFRFLERAIEYEVRRQVELIEDGGTVRQETRLYDPDRNQTRAMRSKEDAQDYRYFPDPDLPPLVIERAWIERVAAGLPELPAAMKARFEREYGLPAYDATMLTQSREMGAYFEDAVRAFGGEAKSVANWMLGEVAAALNRAEVDIGSAPVGPAVLAGLLKRIADGTLSHKTAKVVFDDLWSSSSVTVQLTGVSAQAVAGQIDAVIEAKGLRQISDEGAIEKLVDDVLAANAAIVAEFRAGKEKAFNSLVGKVMAASKGKANPTQVNALLRRKLGA